MLRKGGSMALTRQQGDSIWLNLAYYNEQGNQTEIPKGHVMLVGLGDTYRMAATPGPYAGETCEIGGIRLLRHLSIAAMD